MNIKKVWSITWNEKYKSRQFVNRIDALMCEMELLDNGKRNIKIKQIEVFNL